LNCSLQCAGPRHSRNGPNNNETEGDINEHDTFCRDGAAAVRFEREGLRPPTPATTNVMELSRISSDDVRENALPSFNRGEYLPASRVALRYSAA